MSADRLVAAYLSDLVLAAEPGYTLHGWLGVPIIVALLVAPLVMVITLARKGWPGRSTQ